MVGHKYGLQEREFGLSNSPEGLKDGFTCGSLMTFDRLTSSNNYLPHPVDEHAKTIVVPSSGTGGFCNIIV